MKPVKPVTLLYGILLTTTLLGVSCKKAEKIETADALIVNTGSRASDGCGWLIITHTPDSTYHPVNLSAEYMVDSLKVHIGFHKLNTRYYCGQLPVSKDPGMTEIQIESINKIGQ